MDVKPPMVEDQGDEPRDQWKDSPENPNNWRLRKKLYHTSICAAYAFTITFMSSIYSSGYRELMQKYHVSSTVSLLGVSLFCLGLAFGPIVAAPLSETVGRLVIYRLSLPIAALFLVGAAVSDSLASVLVCRFFAGFFGSPALSVGGGTIADIWQPRYRNRATSVFVMAPNLGPSLGPVIGGFVEEHKGWRWLEWVSVFLALLTYIWAVGMCETYKKAILKKVEKAKVDADSNAASDSVQVSDILKAVKAWMSTTLGRPLSMQVTEPIVLFLSLYVALNFGILYNFFPAVPWSLSRTYGFGQGQSGLSFVAIAIGCLLATTTSVGFDLVLAKKRKLAQAPRPNQLEDILWPAMCGSVGIPIGLFWFAWTVRPDVHWASPVCALIPFAWGNLCIFISAISYLVNIYGPTFGASATAANAFARYGFAAAFPLFAVQMYENLGTGKATSILGACSVAMVPIPWVLYRWGPYIRSRSRRAISLSAY
ncbi:MFS transporter, DHA1 family, multidrug resistance protein [Fonsecaea erecta]|uniref:MFS transporter, DHA1 family, multidrug resistance protein n=1 Tax=Fonsecaea erecta TaxID=1367422 RepID=A0A178ZDA4_9EURO|nr:MFS transporter, DHA1 family, multidrug resistance protein [Fonsecaea erecta]OAP57451.1 MFS transporter, DHA1 family, multidrug resistance protein [Fonsecaea erecta]